MKSKEFRAAVRAAGYEPSDPAAVQRLDSICAVIDVIDALEQAINKDGVLLAGARGQKVGNPALAAVARHRALLDRLLGSLFPDTRDESLSDKRKAAARKRWGR